jgi:hypothetical protein
MLGIKAMYINNPGDTFIQRVNHVHVGTKKRVKIMTKMGLLQVAARKIGKIVNGIRHNGKIVMDMQLSMVGLGEVGNPLRALQEVATHHSLQDHLAGGQALHEWGTLWNLTMWESMYTWNAMDIKCTRCNGGITTTKAINVVTRDRMLGITFLNPLVLSLLLCRLWVPIPWLKCVSPHLPKIACTY